MDAALEDDRLRGMRERVAERKGPAPEHKGLRRAVPHQRRREEIRAKERRRAHRRLEKCPPIHCGDLIWDEWIRHVPP